MRIGMPDGKVGHAELKIGEAIFMLADEFPDYNVFGPEKFGGSPVSIHIYVNDVDAFAKQALVSGLKVLNQIETHVHGDRSGKFVDPFGHVWYFSTRVEDLSNEEMQRRIDAKFGTG